MRNQFQEKLNNCNPLNFEPRLFKKKVSKLLVSMNANDHKSKGYSVNKSECFVINLFKNSSDMLEEFFKTFFSN